MNQKVFVLDDDENSCDLARQVLTKAGYMVAAQTRAIGATNAIRTFMPDLILLDVMMPALSGDNLVEIIKKTVKPNPKIIFYSNKSAAELRILCEETGADGYVCKVDGPSALIRSVMNSIPKT
jgi:two-component system, OmpR family, response regulator